FPPRCAPMCRFAGRPDFCRGAAGPGCGGSHPAGGGRRQCLPAAAAPGPPATPPVPPAPPASPGYPAGRGWRPKCPAGAAPSKTPRFQIPCSAGSDPGQSRCCPAPSLWSHRSPQTGPCPSTSPRPERRSGPAGASAAGRPMFSPRPWGRPQGTVFSSLLLFPGRTGTTKSPSPPNGQRGAGCYSLCFSHRAKSLNDLADDAGTNGTATLTDSETQALFHSDSGQQLNAHDNVIARHAHLGALGQRDNAGHVGGAEVELRTIVGEERGVTAAFLLGQDVDLALELGVGMDGTGLSQDLATRDLGAVHATQQGADVVAGLSEVQALAEHLQTGDGGGDALGTDANDLQLIANLGGAALDTAGSDGATAGNGHDKIGRASRREGGG